jgi:hypothetical protein
MQIPRQALRTTHFVCRELKEVVDGLASALLDFKVHLQKSRTNEELEFHSHGSDPLPSDIVDLFHRTIPCLALSLSLPCGFPRGSSLDLMIQGYVSVKA